MKNNNLFILLILLAIGNVSAQDENCVLEGSGWYMPNPSDAPTTDCTADGKASIRTTDIRNGTPPYSFLWSHGDTTQSVNNLAANTTYYVTVTDAKDCKSNQIPIYSFPAMPPSVSVNFTVRDPHIDVGLSLTQRDEDLLIGFDWAIEGFPDNVRNFTHTFQEPGTYQMRVDVEFECYGVKPFTVIAPLIVITKSGAQIVNFKPNYTETAPSDTAHIPVTVNGFDNILGFQTTMRLEQANGGKIVGTSGYALNNLSIDNFEKINDTTYTTAWFNDTQNTLQSDSVIFYIDAVLSGEVGTCTNILFDGTEIPLQAVIEDTINNNEPKIIPLEGTTEQVCILPPIGIAGKITTPTGIPIDEVSLACTNYPNIINLTDGSYDFPSLQRRQYYIVEPAKNTPLNDEVSTLDLIILLRHILGKEKMDSPYKIVSADVNEDREITIFDIIAVQRAILGKADGYPGANTWSFVPTSHDFPSNTEPTIHPAIISVSELTESLVSQDFIGVQNGDVSFDINTGLTQRNATTKNKTLPLFVENQSFIRNEQLSIPIEISPNQDLIGLQFALNFDTEKLEFVGIKDGAIQKVDYATEQLSEGILPLLWYQPEGKSVQLAATKLIELQFKAKQAGNLKNSIFINERKLLPQAIQANLATKNIQLKFEENENNSLEIFTDFPWLNELIDTENCTNEIVTVYKSGAFNYLLVKNEEGEKLYFENGALYCTNSLNYNCVEAYRLIEISAQWLCDAESVDADEDGTFASDDPDDNDPCVPDNTVNNCIIDADADGVPAADDADDNNPCIPNLNATNCNNADTPTLFQDFPWLKSHVNPATCLEDTILIFQQSVFKYFLVKNEEGEKLYFENGALYCTNSPSYDCISAYNLGEPLDRYVCESPVNNTEVVQFNFGPINGKAGEMASIPVTVKNFKNILGFQTALQLETMNFAKILGVSNFNLQGLGVEDFNLINDQTLSVVWFKEDAVSIMDDVVLFNIEVELMTNEALSCNRFQINSDGIITEVIGIGYKKIDTELNFGEICVESTIVVPPVDGLTFTIGKASGTAGTLLQIPIKVKDFKNILSVQNSVRLAKSNIGKIVGTSNYGLENLNAENFNHINDTLLTLVWFQALPTTLPDDSVIYTVDILLLNNDEATCVDLMIDDTRTPTEIADNQLNIIDYQIVRGKVCLEVIASEQVFISGIITTELDEAIENVTLTSNVETIVSTDNLGFYQFSKLATATDYSIEPIYKDIPIKDVSTLDLVMIMKHILGKERLDSPYKMLAADVNQDGKISAIDLVTTRQLILDLRTEFPNEKSWIFVPKSYQMTIDDMPSIEDIPMSINLMNTEGRYINQDFVGIKLGNVSYELGEGFSNNLAKDRNDSVLPFYIDNQVFDHGEQLEVTFKSDDLSLLLGYQFELDFDPNTLIFKELISKTNKANLAVNTTQTMLGQLPILWYTNEPIDQPKSNDSAPLFTLIFETKKAGDLSELLSINRQQLAVEAITIGNKTNDIYLVFENNNRAMSNLELTKIYPNPATERAWLTINNPVSQSVKIQILDIYGKIRFMQENQLTKGTQEVQLKLDNLQEGIYYLVLKSELNRKNLMRKLSIFKE